jgi:hypothetical protein
MNKKSLIIVLFFALFISFKGYSDVIIIGNGKAAIIRNVTCKNAVLNDGVKCYDLRTPPNNPTVANPDSNNNKTIRNWRKLTKEKLKLIGKSSTKVRRARLKIVDGVNRIYYKNWFLGKKKYIGTLNNE